MKITNIKQFLLKKPIIGKQCLYIRIEGDNALNSGTTMNGEARYSSKTAPKEIHWLDVSSFMDVSRNSRPDDIFHDYLRNNEGWIPEKDHRDLFRGYSVDDIFSAFCRFYDWKTKKTSDPSEIKLRPYQQEGGQFLIDFFQSNKKTALFECITGYGKTITFFYSVLATKIPEINLITNRNLVASAFIEDFKNFNLQNEGLCLITPNQTFGDPDTALQTIRIGASFRNKVFTDSENPVWVIDEAHLGGKGTKVQNHLKNEKVLYITATGNKFIEGIDISYYFGISDMIQALDDGLISREKFPIPNINLNTKFTDYDFGKLKNYPPEMQAKIIDDIVKLNNGKNGIILGQGRCENGFSIAKVAQSLYPNIKWYCSTDGKNSQSFTPRGDVRGGNEAISQFDKDCKKEKNTTHILATVFQGKESYSYFDLYNGYILSDKVAIESFYQFLGRYMREKKHSQSTVADVTLFCPFVEFLVVLEEQFKSECKKKGDEFSQEKFDQFVRMFHVSVDGVETSLTAQAVIEAISIRGASTRKCNTEDWNVLCEIFNGTSSGLSIVSKGFKTKINQAKNSDDVEEEAEEELDEVKTANRAISHLKGQARQNLLDAKEKFNAMIDRLPFYFKYIDCFPNDRQDLIGTNFKNFNFLVYDFNSKDKIKDLFTRLSSETIEIVLKKVNLKKNENIVDLPFMSVDKYGSITDPGEMIGLYSKIEKKIRNIDNKKLLLIRTGIKTLLKIREKTNNIFYLTNIFGEKVLCDQIGVKCNLISNDEWDSILEGLKKVKFDMIIGNPPYNTKNDLHAEIAKKCLTLSDKMTFLMPGTFMKRNGNNRHERFRSAFENSIESYEEVPNMKEVFGISYDEGAIFHFNNNKGKFDYDELMGEAKELMGEAKELMGELENNAYFKSLSKVKNHLKSFNSQKYFIPIGTHGENVLTFAGLVENGICKDGRQFKALLNSEFKDKNNNGLGLSFKSKKEADDFIKNTQSELYRNLMISTKAGTGNNFRHDLNFAVIETLNEKKIPAKKIKLLAERAKSFKSRSN